MDGALAEAISKTFSIFPRNPAVFLEEMTKTLGIWASREGTGGCSKRCSNMRRGCPKRQGFGNGDAQNAVTPVPKVSVLEGVDCTLILPSVTRTLDNSNLPLTRSSFCFSSDHFYIILSSITRTLFWALKSREKQSTGVPNIEFWISHWRVVGI